MSRYRPPLQVARLESSRQGDAERGPAARLHPADALFRLLQDGELVWIQGPRRKELGIVRVDETVPQGLVVLRDVVGASPSEIVHLVKVDTDTAGPRGRFG